MVKRTVFWDFDGTLAYRPKMFSSSLKMVLDEHEPNHKLQADDFVQWLQSGFPWLEPEKEYLNFREPDLWWNNIYGVFEHAYIMNGIAQEKACLYAKETRRYLAAPEYYTLYEDTADTLRYFKENGYSNIILSNHIPELPDIVKSLKLTEYIVACITSACAGYEKPNPAIYKIALETAGYPDEAWMVGDNVNADVRGAENCGIKGILVRRQADEAVRYSSDDLHGVIGIISGFFVGRG